jgi:hypothetical protein
VAQSEIVHAFLESTTCRDLVRELRRSLPVDSNELFDITTSFASGEEAAEAIFNRKKGKRVDDAPAEGSKSKEPPQKHNRGKTVRSRATRRVRRGTTTTGTRPSLLTQLEGVLERPHEAPTYSTTC